MAGAGQFPAKPDAMLHRDLDKLRLHVWSLAALVPRRFPIFAPEHQSDGPYHCDV
jgi:hypothetical protein